MSWQYSRQLRQLNGIVKCSEYWAFILSAIQYVEYGISCTLYGTCTDFLDPSRIQVFNFSATDFASVSVMIVMSHMQSATEVLLSFKYINSSFPLWISHQIWTGLNAWLKGWMRPVISRYIRLLMRMAEWSCIPVLPSFPHSQGLWSHCSEIVFILEVIE